MTIKWYCSENGQSELEISPNYLRNTLLFMVNESGGIPTICELDLEDVDEVIEMLKFLSAKVDEFDKQKLSK